jgi:hypothetical protein
MYVQRCQRLRKLQGWGTEGKTRRERERGKEERRQLKGMYRGRDGGEEQREDTKEESQKGSVSRRDSCDRQKGKAKGMRREETIENRGLYIREDIE